MCGFPEVVKNKVCLVSQFFTVNGFFHGSPMYNRKTRILLLKAYLGNYLEVYQKFFLLI